MEEVYDFGVGVPFTYEDLEIIFTGKQVKRKTASTCASCEWFDPDSSEICNGPVTCLKWAECAKCCSLTGRSTLVPFEECRHFEVDPIMAQ